jgi:hypothetical protein
MLRTVATAFAQAIAIVLGAELCWSLVASFVEKHSFDYGPLLILVLYPLPIAVAAMRKHRALLDIIVTNLWLGWTVIGWFVALIWACNLNVEAAAE